MSVKLCQIIAVEKSVKEKAHKDLTAIYQSLPKADAMNGIARTYRPKDDEGEMLPPETKYVQVRSVEVIDQIKDITGRFMDVQYTKEVGNTFAKADIVVEGKVLLADVPVSFLLNLEKSLNDLRVTLSAFPKLDPAEKWVWNADQQFYESRPIETARTKKTTEFVIAAPATDKHPAQVKEVTNDVIAGYWTTVKMSATMSPATITKLLERCDILLKAVKFAREQANTTEIDQMTCQDAILGYIFG